MPDLPWSGGEPLGFKDPLDEEEVKEDTEEELNNEEILNSVRNLFLT